MLLSFLSATRPRKDGGVIYFRPRTKNDRQLRTRAPLTILTLSPTATPTAASSVRT